MNEALPTGGSRSQGDPDAILEDSESEFDDHVLNTNQPIVPSNTITLNPSQTSHPQGDRGHTEAPKVEVNKQPAKITMNIPTFLSKKTPPISPIKSLSDVNEKCPTSTTAAVSKGGIVNQEPQPVSNIPINQTLIGENLQATNVAVSPIVRVPLPKTSPVLRTCASASSTIRPSPIPVDILDRTKSSENLQLSSPNKLVDPLEICGITPQPIIDCANYPGITFQRLDPQNLDISTSITSLRPPIGNRICNVPGCGNIESPVTKFFDMPPQHAHSWCQILGIRNNSNDLREIKICFTHFDDAQFTGHSIGPNMSLKSNAVPRAISILESGPVKAEVCKTPALSLTRQKQLKGDASSTSSTDSQNSRRSAQRAPAESPPSMEISPEIQQQMHSPSVSLSEPPRPVATSITNQYPTKAVSLNTKLRPGQNDSPGEDEEPAAPLPTTKPSSKRNVTNAKLPTTSIDKVAGNIIKLHGPKSQLKAEDRAIVQLGPYSRPNLPSKIRQTDVSREDLRNLVMPSEDWSVNVYSSPNRTGKPIYVISETLLNSDLVEIVRKSITILPNWAMKFSVMTRDASNFNLGLDVSDVSDVQAILDNFDNIPVCKGLVVRSNNLIIQKQLESFVDKKFRSVKCPLLLVGNYSMTEKTCMVCQKLVNTKHY